jgi:hypothetical protein
VFPEDEPVTPRPRYELLLTPEPGLVPEIHRLRRCLKALLRCYGLRCLEVREVAAAEPAETGSADADTDVEEVG